MRSGRRDALLPTPHLGLSPAENEEPAAFVVQGGAEIGDFERKASGRTAVHHRLPFCQGMRVLESATLVAPARGRGDDRALLLAVGGALVFAIADGAGGLRMVPPLRNRSSRW